jgi:hypothetical protein
MKQQQKFRQTIKTSFLILIFFGGIYLQNGFYQDQKSKIDYSVKSNILNPDTLKGDMKIIFWHFVELTHKQAEDLKPLEIKAEFEKLGITLNEDQRFKRAWDFFDLSVVYHKKSCEQWESFKDLAPIK